MKKFRCIIENEDEKRENYKIIFERTGKFKDKKEALKALYHRVCIDIPSEYSLVHNMKFGGGFDKSPFCLKRFYNDITKLKFIVEEI